MTRFPFVLIMCLICTQFAFAQDPATTAPALETTIVLARYGERFASQNTATMHYLEGFQIRNRWVLPDIGYIDFGHSDYREVFVGGGYTLIDGKHLSLVQEGFFVQASGAAANEAQYVMPWT